MNNAKYACAALLATMAGTAWSDARIAIHGRAGMPVGSDRHAYIVDTARPPSFDAQLQAPAGAGRAGGQAANALANAHPPRTGVASTDDRLRPVAYGRAGFVPEFLAVSPPYTGAGHRAVAHQSASAARAP